MLHRLKHHPVASGAKLSMTSSNFPAFASKFRCPRCNKGLANNSTALKAHAWANPCRFSCPREMIAEIEEEMLCYHSMFSCTHCDRRFNSEENLGQHLADKHGVCEQALRSRSPVGRRENASWGSACWGEASWGSGSWGGASWGSGSSGDGRWTAGRDWVAAGEARAGEAAAQDTSDGSRWQLRMCWVKM